MQIGLGTAQFGGAYGVTNTRGRISDAEGRAILRASERAGIQVIDTAAAYGDAEAVLGRLLWAGHSFRLITKTRPLASATISKKDVLTVRDAYMRSLERLNVPRAAGLLLHHADELARPGAELLAEQLIELRRNGLVERLGVSCYRPEELRLASTLLPLDLIQIPLNIFDRRFLTDGSLGELKRTGTEIHARSAFLQGLLLQPAALLPERFAPYRSAFEKLHAHASRHGRSLLELALCFMAGCADIDIAVVGVTGTDELDAITKAQTLAVNSPMACEGLDCNDERLLNPSLWQTLGNSIGMTT